MPDNLPAINDNPGEIITSECTTCDFGWIREFQAGGAYSHRVCPQMDTCKRPERDTVKSYY